MTENTIETKESIPEQSSAPVMPPKIPRKPTPHYLVFVCGVIALLLLGFIGGQAYERARIRHFARWQDNYQQNFFGNRNQPARGEMMQERMLAGPFRSHAILGTVLSVNNNSVSIQDQDGNVEQAINISNSTVIQKNNGRGIIADLQQGQRIAIFGRPTNNGQIDASLIRILNNATATSVPSTSASPVYQNKN